MGGRIMIKELVQRLSGGREQVFREEVKPGMYTTRDLPTEIRDSIEKFYGVEALGVGAMMPGDERRITK